MDNVLALYCKRYTTIDCQNRQSLILITTQIVKFNHKGLQFTGFNTMNTVAKVFGVIMDSITIHELFD